ncbi:unnamed protein product [Parajaminaea phylloscopi]
MSPTAAIDVDPSPSRTQSFHGKGLAILRSHPSKDSFLASAFTHLSFSFPLKLITPRTTSRDASVWVQSKGYAEGKFRPCAVAALYVVGYGGGLVSGDDVDLDIDVGHQCTLLLLTQGTTKVFKMRTSAASARSPRSPTITSQRMRFLVRPDSNLVLLPDAVTCYAQSRYLQVQRFDLLCPYSSSLLVLDWITPGRHRTLHKTLRKDKGGEEWEFESYRSRNEVRIRGIGVVVRDVLELAQGNDVKTALKERTRPYRIYASLFLVGANMAPCVEALEREWRSIQQRPVVLMSGHGNGRHSGPTSGGQSGSSRTPSTLQAARDAEAKAAGLPLQQVFHNGADEDDASGEGAGGGMQLLWSFSHLQLPPTSGLPDKSGPLGGLDHRAHPASKEPLRPIGAVVRLAAMSTDEVKLWLRTRLGHLQDRVIGPDLYRSALG